MKIFSANDSIFQKVALDYLEQGDVDHSIPSEGHVDDAARWSPEPETKNKYATEDDHDRLRDAGFAKPEDEDGSYIKWHEGDEADVHRISHAIWPSQGGLWTHVKQDLNLPWPDQYVKTHHPDLTGALREYNRYRMAEPRRYLSSYDPQFEDNRTCLYYMNCNNPASAVYDHPQFGPIPTCDEHGAKKGIKDTERWHPYLEGFEE